MLETPVFLERRARVAVGLELRDEIILVGAGHAVPLPENTDQTYPFRSHAEYFFLSGLECAGGIIAFDPRESPGRQWTSFVPAVTENERIWEGRAQPPGELLENLDGWLTRRRGRLIAVLGESLRGVCSDPGLTSRVRELLQHARRPKDAQEIALLRRAAAATGAGYAAIREHIRPGVTERSLQIELEAAFFRGGGTRTGYGTIVGGGPNAAVFHFEPSARAVRENEFVLIDAGAEVDRYVCDVTRTFVAGSSNGFQRDLHQIVLGALESAIAQCLPGTEWRNIHYATSLKMTEGLVSMGVMRGEPFALVEQTAHTLFFPHGIGHMVGLGVRDASGTLPGRARSNEPALSNLRTDMPLAPGYVMTVEPGLYFIPALLQDRERRERFREAVNWELVDTHLDVGGVRIEDNVLIRDSGPPENLTAAIPKGLAV